MSVSELKKNLIEKIEATDNEILLETVYDWLKASSDESSVYILSDYEKSVLAESREQIKNGEVFTDEEVDKEIDEWLNE